MARKKKTVKEEIIPENTNEQFNILCRDCINDCKQKAGVAILSCPQKIKIDVQLTLFKKDGKPRKWR